MKNNVDYRDFLQTDPRYNEKEAWTEEKFPYAQYRYLREAGCLICSLAFLLRYHEIEKETDINVFNPWILCEKLIGIKAFLPSADLEIAAVSRLYPIGYLGVVSYSREALLDAAENGYICLMTVSGNNGPVHFIALEELTESDAVVFDPKEGIKYLSEYDRPYQIRLFRITDHIRTGYDYVFEDGRSSSSKRETGRIAIGFDDGPSKNNTARVLDVLKAYDSRASFFLIGKLISGNEHLVQRMIREGHQIGVHGWDHLYLNALTAEECRINLRKTADGIKKACGITPGIMRPPGGYANENVLKAAEDLNMSVIGWCVDSGDWEYGATAHKVADSVLNSVYGGDIILMHDIHANTVDALEILIPELIRRGLVPVTLDELAAESGGLKLGRVYNWF